MDQYITYDGITAYGPGGYEYDVNDLIARGIDVLGAWTSRSPYISPDDPRYQQGQYPVRPPSTFPSNVPNSPVSLNPNGFAMPWWALLGIGVVVGSFLLGKGRR
jgi:hypothetical protein